MHTDENLDFAARLQLALKRADKTVSTPTELALQFNLRHKNEPITAQAANKWLKGKAKPTPDKIDTLATWLNVSSHWLRFGPPDPVKPKSKPAPPPTFSAPTDTESRLLMRFRQLSAHQQGLIVDLIEQIINEREVWSNAPD